MKSARIKLAHLIRRKQSTLSFANYQIYMYQNIHKECWSVFIDLLDLTLKINSHSAKAHYHHWQQNSKEICINKQKNNVRKCTKQQNSCHAVLWLYAKSFCLQKQYGSQKKQTGEFLCAESIWQPKKPRQDTYSSPSHQTYQHSRQNHRKPARHLHTDAQKHM